MSDERLSTYMKAAGYDADRALRLYLWNARVGEAFHLPIQAVEVGLRNRIHTHMIHTFGAGWWCAPAFEAVTELDRVRDIEIAVRRIGFKRGKLTDGQVVATLSFGFWSGLLKKRYNPTLWSGKLPIAFPCLPPGIDRSHFFDRVKRVSDFRNRVWHHEPIFKQDLLAEYAATMQVLGWICSDKAAWVKPFCRVPALVREKP